MSRVPSTQAHEAVLKAALKLIADQGIDSTSVDDIANASGVSKATIYKHWPNKEALCLEAISRLRCDLPVFDSGNPREDLIALLRHIAVTQKPEAFSRVWPRVMSYAESNPAFARAFRERLSEGARAQLVALLRQAVEKNELRATLDMDLSVDLLFGPIMYHRFMQAPVPAKLPEQVVDSFWRVNAPVTIPVAKQPAGKLHKIGTKLSRPRRRQPVTAGR